MCLSLRVVGSAASLGGQRRLGCCPPPLGDWQLSPEGFLEAEWGAGTLQSPSWEGTGGGMLRLPGLCWGSRLFDTTGPSSWRVWLWGSRG